MDFRWDKNFAKKLDNNDELSGYRNEFIFPQHDGENCIYLTGNSLGLQPKGAKAALQQELDDWGKYGVLPGNIQHWYASESFLSEIVGAKPYEGVRHMSMESIYEYGSRQPLSYHVSR